MSAPLGNDIVRRQDTGFEQVTRGPRADQRGEDEQPHLAERGWIGPGADQRRPERTGRIQRRAGDVQAPKMDCDQREADRKPGKSDRRASLRDAEDADQEQESADDFLQKRRGEIELAEIARSPPVLGKRPGPAGGLA